MIDIFIEIGPRLYMGLGLTLFAYTFIRVLILLFYLDQENRIKIPLPWRREDDDQEGVV